MPCSSIFGKLPEELLIQVLNNGPNRYLHHDTRELDSHDTCMCPSTLSLYHTVKVIEAFLFLVLEYKNYYDQVKKACKDYCEDIDLRQLSSELRIWALKWTAKKQLSDIELAVPRYSP